MWRGTARNRGGPAPQAPPRGDVPGRNTAQRTPGVPHSLLQAYNMLTTTIVKLWKCVTNG